MTTKNCSSRIKQNQNKINLNLAPLLGISFFLMCLTACGETDQQTNSEQINIEQQTANQTANSNSAPIIEEDKISLSTTPIEKLAFLGISAPVAKEVSACPYLSDDTALATVDTDWVLKRRQSSSQGCLWSKNTGFSIKLTIEPLATAKPVQERAYNLDNPPVIKKQTAPGYKAVTLHDNTWDKERPYAMAFEQNNQLIVIYVTGMKTSVDRLMATATEVASKLANPNQQNSIKMTSNTLSDSFNMCSIWSQLEIEAVLGQPVKVTPGTLDCKWEVGQAERLKQIRVTIYSGKSYPWDELIARGEQAIDDIGERGLIETKRKRNNMPAHVLLNTLYQEKLVTITTTDTITDHMALALALSKNIDRRLQ